MEEHVIFGAGPVGRALMRELLARGGAVRMVSLSGSGEFPEAVEVRAGDAADRRFAREVCSGADVVYQCSSPPYHRWPELLQRIQAGVVEGAAAAGAKLVVMDNVYLYGHPYGAVLTEKRPTTAMTRKGKVRADMATALMKAHQKGRVRVAIGRASDFFGPEVIRSAMGAQVFRAALRGEPAQVLGDPTQLHTYTYVPDIARGLAILGRREQALGRAWHLPSAETVTTRDFLAMVFAETGHPPKVRRLGRATLRILGYFKPEVRELVEMMYQFEEPFVVDHSHFEETFGDIATPLPEAIRETVAWYRDEGDQESAPTDEPAATAETDETKETEEGGADAADEGP